MTNHRIILTGGGTGGHVYPALAAAERLKMDPDVEAILYVGSKGHIEERLARDNQLEFVGLNSSGLPRKFSVAMLQWPFKFISAVQEAQTVLRSFAPTAVLGTGGYASAPVLLAALLKGGPYAIHEPDAYPGLVNRVFSKGAQVCCLGMEGAAERLGDTKGHVEVIGNPVRLAYDNLMARDAAAAVLGFDPTLKTILVMGGSQGAAAINEALVEVLPS